MVILIKTKVYVSNEQAHQACLKKYEAIIYFIIHLQNRTCQNWQHLSGLFYDECQFWHCNAIQCVGQTSNRYTVTREYPRRAFISSVSLKIL